MTVALESEEEVESIVRLKDAELDMLPLRIGTEEKISPVGCGGEHFSCLFLFVLPI